MRTFFIAAVVLSLSACASQDPGPVGGATAPVIVASNGTQLTTKTELVCHKEASLGSQMLHTVCAAPQTDADRNTTQEQLRNMAPPNSVTHPGIGH
jgi:starvation-inducible outer membrane lipoprotein